MKILKGLLRAVIFGVLSMAVPSVWAQAGAHTMVTPGDLKWVDVPSLPSGAKLAVIDPMPTEQASGVVRHPAVDSAFRAIMFTDLKDSTATTSRLGDVKALHLIHIHNA